MAESYQKYDIQAYTLHDMKDKDNTPHGFDRLMSMQDIGPDMDKDDFRQSVRSVYGEITHYMKITSMEKDPNAHPSERLLAAGMRKVLGDRPKRGFNEINRAGKNGAPPALVCYCKSVALRRLSKNTDSTKMQDRTLKYALRACRLDDSQNGEFHAIAASELVRKFKRDYHGDERDDETLLVRAIHHGKKALEFGSTDAITYNTLGHASLDLDRDHEAMAYFEQLLKISPNDSDAHLMMAYIMSLQEDKPASYYKDALHHINIALKTMPPDEFMLEIKEDLECSISECDSTAD